MKGKKIGKILINILVILGCCIYLFPVYLIIVNAFKSRAELYENILAFPKQITWEYFAGALEKMDFVRAFGNSIIVTAISVIIIVILSAMTAWMFVRSNGKLSNFLLNLLIVTMLIPFQTIMMPLILVHTEKEKFPLLMHYHPLHLYRYQVCKQADTVLAYFLFPEYQSEEVMRNSFLYYETITTHDSSLSTCVFSIEASRLGMTDKAYAYFGDSAKLDLLNTHNNTKDGIHAANMGGCYMAVINGFAGLRISGEGIEIAPALPEQWNGYHFRFRYHDSSVRICVDKEKIAVELTQGGPVSMKVYGRSMQLLPGQPISEKLRR